MIKSVMIKVGKMRKADDCVVYPETYPDREMGEGLRFVQGGRLVMFVDMNTGKAKANYKTGSTYPTSWHLINHPGIEIVQLTPEQVQEIKDATPRSGDLIGGGVFIK